MGTELARVIVDMAGTDHLQRFVDAQRPVYERVRAELVAGQKKSHWMWFIFPQLAGLGMSPTAQRYAIASLAGARAYLAHPVLGPRLRECAALVNAVKGRTAGTIFGYPDELKFRSSMTLFSRATGDNAVFLEALRKYYCGEPDRRTIELLERNG